MCGFFGISDKSKIKYEEFKDVKERGVLFFKTEHSEFFSIQSVLPCTGTFCGQSLYESERYIFNYTGEIYNYDRRYKNDTEYLFDLIDKNNDFRFINNLNGMFAISIYDKQANTTTLIRDSIGQIPLFYYNQSFLVYSNTLPSIVKNVNTFINEEYFENWLTTKHYIFQDTVWKDIRLFPKGHIITFDSEGNILYKQTITKQNSIKNSLHSLLSSKLMDYTPSIEYATIFSGGVDSSIISKYYERKSSYVLGINNVNKDYISNEIDLFRPNIKHNIDIIDITEKEWAENAIELMHRTLTVPFSWSWVGYYIIGKQLNKKNINVCLTGEGADEIFGGYSYDGLSTRGLTKQDAKRLLSYVTDTNKFNRFIDKEVFVPIGGVGSNLAMGVSCVEPRHPFLDHEIFYNSCFETDTNKSECKKIFNSFFPKIEIKPKQGFSGFPNELYKYVNVKTRKRFNDSNSKWKFACKTILQNIM